MKTIGLILAGGLSSRMGKNKAELNLDGKSFLEKQFRLLSSIGALTDVYVSGSFVGFICIPDLLEKAGPIGGIHSALERFKSEPISLLVVPIDMPLILEDTLVALLKCQESFCEYDCYRFADHELPLIIKNNVKVQKALGELLSSSNRRMISIRNLISKLNSFSCELTNPMTQQFVNINTREDYERIIGDAHKACKK